MVVPFNGFARVLSSTSRGLKLFDEFDVMVYETSSSPILDFERTETALAAVFDALRAVLESYPRLRED